MSDNYDQPKMASDRPSLGALIDQLGKNFTEADTILDTLTEMFIPVMDSSVRSLEVARDDPLGREPELPPYLDHAKHLVARSQVLIARLRDIRDRARL